MQLRKLVITMAAASGLLLAACGSPDSGGGASGGAAPSGPTTLTVWYMSGSLPDDVAASAKKDFESAHPGVTVDYQVQQWDGIGEKLTTALAGNQPPDVLEIGNTQVSQYAAAGGLDDLTAATSTFDNHDTWLKGLADPGKWDGKTYGIPFYAGARTVIYRKDMFQQAGVAVPTSWDQLLATGAPLKAKFGSDARFTPMYLPGQEWYTLASLVWDEGGDLAVQDNGTWKGALNTPQAKAGVARYQALYQALSNAPADADEATPQQYEVMAKGSTAMMIGLPWEIASAIKADPTLKDKLGTFALPSKNAGQVAPPFVGGSDLAVPAGSDAKELATAFVAELAGTPYQTKLAQAGAIPNASALSSAVSSDPTLQTAVKAAAAGRSTPIAPGWNSVETAPNPLKDMLTQVLQKTPIDTAVTAADTAITQRMGQGQ
jgi:N,N'-diacetylchitobiose transport system substrate-binding protein